MTLTKHVVVVGGGFGGLSVTKALAGAPVQITLVDERNHHLFQPLLYQVAMAGLSPAEVAVPIRRVFRARRNVRVILDSVTRIELDARRAVLREMPPLQYDYLVVACGARTTYFGHDDWAGIAPGLKDIDDAVEIRRRVLVAFEAAERESDLALQRRYLTFVVIGGGPTGVELAGAIAELASYVLASDFRHIRPESTRVILVEAGPRLLSALDPLLSERAAETLRAMGVEVLTGKPVTSMDETQVVVGDAVIETCTVLWAAGVAAVPLVAQLGPTDRGGRVKVSQDCSVPGHPEVFCVGDAAAFVPEGEQAPLPGVSPVAMQQGRFVARQIRRDIYQKPRERFVYRDKGTMATIGRSRAVAQVGKLRISGFLAWLLWLLVHIYYLIDFRNRVLVLINWFWSYLSYYRGARLITGHRTRAGPNGGAPSRRAGSS